MWTFIHVWPSGARFIFNFHRHCSSLVLRNGNGTASFMYIKEGVMQGDPLVIIAYGIFILPLIKNLKHNIPDVTQPQYAENARDLGTFARIETYFNFLTRQGPECGYYPGPSKSMLIVHPDNLEAGKYFGECHKFKVFTGARYLGGCIRDDESNSDWLREHTLR